MDKEETDLTPLDYAGELTSEALSVLNVYSHNCCNQSLTAKKLHKDYIQVRKFLKQPYVRELFKLSLLKKGVTPDKIAEVIFGGLEAKDQKGNPDWFARHRFAQLSAEIYEVLKYNVKAEINTVQDNKIVIVYKDAAQPDRECEKIS